VLALVLQGGVLMIAIGIYSVTHAERSPETPAGHWLSTPAGRRTGGWLFIVVGASGIVTILAGIVTVTI
jgi:hypothetical protein